MKQIMQFFLHPLSRFQQILAFLLGFAVLFLAYSDAARRQWDFAVYYLASKAIWSGINIYDSAQMQHFADEIDGVGYAGLSYLYPPLTARLLSPIGWIPYFPASFSWMVLKCVALEVTIFMSLSIMRLNKTILAFMILQGAAIHYYPIDLDFNAGNIAVFESTLFLCCLMAWQHKKLSISAPLLAFSSLMKLYPLLFALYPLHLREKRFLRALAVALAFVGAANLLDYENFHRFIQYFQSPVWQTMWDEQVQSFYNCSYTTVILRSFSDTYFAQPLFESPLLVALLIPLFPVAILLIMAFIVHQREKQSIFNPAATEILCMIICSILLLTPRLAGYTLAWTFLPATFSVWFSIQKRLFLPLFISLTGIILLQIYLPPQRIPHGFTQLLIDKDFFGLLLLFISNSILSWKAHSQATSNPINHTN
ncbi:MAG: DUF2029 domain-containing protein [Candidatus Omnitrophota bacterium]|jgi:hypothetical protein|nr:MAG: DUF2029 domain-containing protein [Candidatus Omnitrophota bacterium]